MISEQLFWLFLQLLVISARTHKINEILKDVGKRYILLDDHYTVLDNDYIKRSKENWEIQTDEYVKYVRLLWAGNLTNHIRWSSSVFNDWFHAHAEMLTFFEHEDMVGEVCGSEAKFNKFQFEKHLRKQRGDFAKLDKDAPYSFQILEGNDKQRFDMIVRVDLEARMGYKTTVVWNIKVNYTTIVQEQLSYFQIVHVKIGGGCTEFGTVDLNFTDAKQRDETLKLLKAETNPNVQQLFDLFTPAVMQQHEDMENNIPTMWMNALEFSIEKYSMQRPKVTICNEREKMHIPLYSVEQFHSWYKRFGQMWHPKKGDKDYIKVQMLDASDHMLTARVTMRLQIGTNENATTHDWEFKMQFHHNVSGNEAWTISELNVLCQPHINLMDENLLAMPEMVGKDLMEHYDEAGNWYTAINALKNFEKKAIKTVGCGISATSVDELAEKFFDYTRRHDNSTFSGFFIRDTQDVPAKPEDTFHIRMALQPYEPFGLNQTWGTRWTFIIEWDMRDQFYYITGVAVGCPTMMSPEGEWVSRRRPVGMPPH